MVRVLAAVVCVLVGLACGYGLLASREPGVSRAWRAGYAGGAGLALIGLLVVVRARRHA
ncbi:MAG: hypothetical protein JNM07_07965 [Phycisphaerae bacterium]|nr:hypothetical protein [Phycisphaerae bacterium]